MAVLPNSLNADLPQGVTVAQVAAHRFVMGVPVDTGYFRDFLQNGNKVSLGNSCWISERWASETEGIGEPETGAGAQGIEKRIAAAIREACPG